MRENRPPTAHRGRARRVGIAILAAGLALALAGCNRGGGATDEEAAVGSSTTTTTTTSTTLHGDTTTSTTAQAPAPLVYEIRQRIPGDDGDVLVVLIEPGEYTDVQLENLIGDILEEHGPLAELHVVDDLAALPILLEDPEERTPEEQALLEAHYLVKVEEGSLVTFMGPYAEYGTTVIGS